MAARAKIFMDDSPTDLCLGIEGPILRAARKVHVCSGSTSCSNSTLESKPGQPKTSGTGSIPELSLEIIYHQSYIPLSTFADKWSVSLSGARSDYLQKSTMGSPASLRGSAHMHSETMRGLPQWLWV